MSQELIRQNIFFLNLFNQNFFKILLAQKGLEGVMRL